MIRSMTRSTLENKVNYRSLLAGNTAFIPSTPAYDFLETVDVASDSTSVTITGLNTYTDYKHLQIFAQIRTDRSGGDNDEILVEINGATTNYYRNIVAAQTSNMFEFSTGPESNGARISQATGSTSLANDFASTLFEIPNFLATGQSKVIRSMTGDEVRSAFFSGMTTSDTSALNSLEFSPVNGTNIVTGSSFDVFGIKGS